MSAAVDPVGRIVGRELADKLDVEDLRLDFSGLRSSDVTGRARAFAGMVGAGLSIDQAAQISGLIDQE